MIRKRSLDLLAAMGLIVIGGLIVAVALGLREMLCNPLLPLKQTQTIQQQNYYQSLSL